MAIAAAILVGFIAVAAAADVPMIRPPGRKPYWPGSGFVLLVAVGIVGLACFIDAVLAGRARRHGRQGSSTKPDEST